MRPPALPPAYLPHAIQPSTHLSQVDAAYAAHTSLKAYMPYMLGGGYVLSADLAEVGVDGQVV